MNVFDLFAKIGLDTSDYEDGLKKASDKTSGFMSKVGSGIATAGKAIAGATVAAGAAVAKITTSAISAYSDYEQMVGGVKTLFGANEMSLQEYAKSVGKTVEETKSSYNELIKAQNIVLQDAADAWKDVGMSANEYMENATSFAASLKQSLGGDSVKAAEKTKIALTDIADNANKMGTDMGSLTWAYQGFAKQNYTMLDNLKLGYGGTKQEMERLLADAEKLTGVKYDISKYGDIVDAIHAIQTEMNVTGTTAKEAMSTIQGSAGMLKSAWQNLLTGLPDEEADVGKLISNFSTALNALINNVSPRIKQALPAIAKALNSLNKQVVPILMSNIKDLVPYIADGIVSIISTIGAILPDLLTSAIDLVEILAPKLINSLADIGKTLGAALPSIGNSLVKLATDAINYVANNFDGIIKGVGNFISTAANSILSPENVSSIFKAVTNLITSAASWIADPENIDKIISAAGKLFGGIVDGLEDAWPAISAKITSTIDDIVKKWNDYWETSGEEFNMAVTGDFDEDWQPTTITGKLGKFGYGLGDAIRGEDGNGWMDLWQEGYDNLHLDEVVGTFDPDDNNGFLGLLKTGFGHWDSVEDNPFGKFGAAISDAKDKLVEFKETYLTLGDIEEGGGLLGFLSAGDEGNPFYTMGEQIATVVGKIQEFGSSWVSTLEGAGEKIADFDASCAEKFGAIKTSISDAWDNVKEKTSETWNNIKTTCSTTCESMKTTVSGTWNSIKETAASKWEEIKTTIKSKVDSIVSSALTWGKDMIDNFVSGIKSAWGNLVSTVSDVASTVKSFLGFSEPEQGPLSDFHTYAPDMMDLFAKGIKDNERKVLSNVSDVASGVRTAFESGSAVATLSANGIANTADRLSGTSIVNNFTISGGNAQEIADTVAEKIQEALDNLQMRQNLALGR